MLMKCVKRINEIYIVIKFSYFSLENLGYRTVTQNISSMLGCFPYAW